MAEKSGRVEGMTEGVALVAASARCQFIFVGHTPQRFVGRHDCESSHYRLIVTLCLPYMGENVPLLLERHLISFYLPEKSGMCS